MVQVCSKPKNNHDESGPSMRILLADDHDLVRETIAAFLQANGFAEISLAASIGDARVLLAEKAYDLLLLDYSMPDMNGLESMGQLRAEHPKLRVAILSGSASRDLAEAALRAGAVGFLPKTLSAQGMVAAIRAMLAGQVYMPADLLVSDAAQGEGMLSLTRRETDVLRGLCAGKSNKEIARDLDLQEVTVKLHVKTLSRKLSARNRTHAAMIARDEGLI
jgi:two-component system, NarL family, nitrate/nitrite response regulator NarL